MLTGVAEWLRCAVTCSVVDWRPSPGPSSIKACGHVCKYMGLKGSAVMLNTIQSAEVKNKGISRPTKMAYVLLELKEIEYSCCKGLWINPSSWHLFVLNNILLKKWMRFCLVIWTSSSEKVRKKKYALTQATKPNVEANKHQRRYFILKSTRAVGIFIHFMGSSCTAVVLAGFFRAQSNWLLDIMESPCKTFVVSRVFTESYHGD